MKYIIPPIVAGCTFAGAVLQTPYLIHVMPFWLVVYGVLGMLAAFFRNDLEKKPHGWRTRYALSWVLITTLIAAAGQWYVSASLYLIGGALVIASMTEKEKTA